MPALDPRVEKAFDFASDATKQLIALSTGILTLTITFAKDILRDVTGLPRGLLGLAWLGYLVSVVAGVWVLLALTGTLEPPPGAPADVSIRGKNVVWPSIVQVLMFLAATALVVAFGLLVAFRR
ncbi:MAG: hypothetical protein HY728_09615 [Candidatus Rokubacteria bacterium]|nr:hypothetical protein [Candidatus Rokubacteria bacterium]MBI4594460.1 hypothetical protein [Candidatus Rokubacteria bacterium]